MEFCFEKEIAYAIIGSMRRPKFGFTLIEVTLFLAITGLLFIGIAAGVQNSIFQQRYNDSVQNFAEFLRSIYSQVSNVESDKTVGGGRSDQAIYGKLVTFGESKNLAGDPNTDNAIFVYTVVGDIEDKFGSTGDTWKDLGKLNINVVSYKEEDDGTYGVSLAGIAESYVPRWGAKIECIDSGGRLREGYFCGKDDNSFNGSLLIVRHPRSGTIYTYVYNFPIEVNDVMKFSPTSGLDGARAKEFKLHNNRSSIGADSQTKMLYNFSFDPGVVVDFCVDPNGGGGDVRRDVRLAANARNASGVEVMPADSEENKCRK